MIVILLHLCPTIPECTSCLFLPCGLELLRNLLYCKMIPEPGSKGAPEFQYRRSDIVRNRIQQVISISDNQNGVCLPNIQPDW